MDQKRNDTYWLWRVTLSGGALYAERLWRAFWPVWIIAGAFLAVSLFDLFSWLPGWLHAVSLVLFIIALITAL